VPGRAVDRWGVAGLRWRKPGPARRPAPGNWLCLARQSPAAAGPAAPAAGVLPGRGGANWVRLARFGSEYRLDADRTGLSRPKAVRGPQTRSLAFGNPVRTVPDRPWARSSPRTYSGLLTTKPSKVVVSSLSSALLLSGYRTAWYGLRSARSARIHSGHPSGAPERRTLGPKILPFAPAGHIPLPAAQGMLFNREIREPGRGGLPCLEILPSPVEPRSVAHLGVEGGTSNEENAEIGRHLEGRSLPAGAKGKR
jgi:hypothetical protein